MQTIDTQITSTQEETCITAAKHTHTHTDTKNHSYAAKGESKSPSGRATAEDSRMNAKGAPNAKALAKVKAGQPASSQRLKVSKEASIHPTDEERRIQWTLFSETVIEESRPPRKSRKEQIKIKNKTGGPKKKKNRRTGETRKPIRKKQNKKTRKRKTTTEKSRIYPTQKGRTGPNSRGKNAKALAKNQRQRPICAMSLTPFHYPKNKETQK